MSVAYIRPKSRIDRPRNTEIGTEVDHVTFDSDTTFKVKKSKVEVTSPFCSPPCWRVRQLQQWAWERVGSGKLLLACYVAISSATQGASMPTGGRGGGISWRPPAYSLLYLIL